MCAHSRRARLAVAVAFVNYVLVFTSLSSTTVMQEFDALSTSGPIYLTRTRPHTRTACLHSVARLSMPPLYSSDMDFMMPWKPIGMPCAYGLLPKFASTIAPPATLKAGSTSPRMPDTWCTTFPSR